MGRRSYFSTFRNIKMKTLSVYVWKPSRKINGAVAECWAFIFLCKYKSLQQEGNLWNTGSLGLHHFVLHKIKIQYSLPVAASRGLSGIKVPELYIPFFLTSISNCSFGQGQSRRIQVEVKSVQESGTLPLMEESILSVGIGCVQIKHVKSQNYQVKLWIFAGSYFQEL